MPGGMEAIALCSQGCVYLLCWIRLSVISDFVGVDCALCFYRW